jgi:hypothetical protein
MSIVTLTFPPGTSRVKYGAAEMIVADDGTLDVPAYVAKALLALPGVTGPAQKSSTATLLNGVKDDFELNYLFLAHGRAVPEDKFEAVLEERPVMAEVPNPDAAVPDFEGPAKVLVDTGEKAMVDTGERALVEAAEIKTKAASLLTGRGEPVAALI